MSTAQSADSLKFMGPTIAKERDIREEVQIPQSWKPQDAFSFSFAECFKTKRKMNEQEQ